MFMTKPFLVLLSLAFLALSPHAIASQASDADISIISQESGPTPFIAKLTLSVGDLSTLKRVRFAITPKPGSVARPLSATYSKRYLVSRGYVDSSTGRVTVPVFGLYAGYNNTVALKYIFHDGSTRAASTAIHAAPFDDACHYKSRTVWQQARSSVRLSYHYIMVMTSCSPNSPTVIDTDGEVRWVGTGGVARSAATFYRNGVYLSNAGLVRIELDGEVNRIADLESLDIVGLHHSIDPGKQGLVLDVNTTDWVESVNVEIDALGNVLRRWSLGDIIREAMVAGGDDPSEFVRNAKGEYNYHAYEDWFHNNSTTYRKSDNSLIVSSRENFVIAIDYDSHAIKWILGDKTKQWYQYPSLRKYALERTPGTLAPLGQHTVSITKDDRLLLFDNGQFSKNHFPRGNNRSYSAPRKYQLNLLARTAHEVWNFRHPADIRSPFRSSVYEDASSNYLVHYSNAPQFPRIVGLAPSGAVAFDYGFPGKAFRSIPVHWERLMFLNPVTAGPAANDAENEDETLEEE